MKNRKKLLKSTTKYLTPVGIFIVSIGVGSLILTIETALLFAIFTTCFYCSSDNREFSLPSNLIRGFRVQNQTPKSTKTKENLIPWGAYKIKKENECKHFIIFGNTGRGKSTILEILAKKTLGNVGIQPNCRGVVIDAKADQAAGLVPKLEKMKVPYLIMNPLDKRCTAWDIATDINSSGLAQEFMSTIIPDAGENGNSYFTDSARIIGKFLIESLQIAKPHQWTLRDFTNAISNKEDLLALVNAHHHRAKSIHEYFASSNKKNDVLTTLQANAYKFEKIAARWEHAKEKISITNWVKHRENSILVLGSDYEYPDTMKIINALLISRISTALLNLSEDKTNQQRTYLFFDEFTNGAKYENLLKLLQTGRSKGISIIITLLSTPLLEELYGENEAKSIIELCRHRAILGVGGTTAERLSDFYGEFEYVEEQSNFSSSSSSSANGGSYSETYGSSKSIKMRKAITTQQLMSENPNFPDPNPGRGLTGYFSAPDMPFHRHTYSGEQINRMKPQSSDIPAYDRVNEDDPNLTLRPWSNRERKALKLPKN